jgi:glycoprotein endo-alpha-1,2-mannosidase
MVKACHAISTIWEKISMLRLVSALSFSLALCAVASAEPDPEVHAFYYTWYANPETDGTWSHWNHFVMLQDGQGPEFTPPESIGANFYPGNGLYSSNSLEDTRVHFRQLKAAGVGTVAVTWWGAGDFTDKALEVSFAAAKEEGMKVCFHIEPFGGRNGATSKDALIYLLDKYGDHPALYRSAQFGNRPVAYMYDSYLVQPEGWATILDPAAENTIRGTKYDTAMIGLWVKGPDGEKLKAGGFDGAYTYFATDGFTYGSTVANWPSMAEWCRENALAFVPSVGPGYDDTRIRPWNTKNQRDRENGAYYDRMWQAAIGVQPQAVSITSFNEWHEGTQIEPAVPKVIEGYTYLDYGERAPAYYLERTAHWVEEWGK